MRHVPILALLGALLVATPAPEAAAAQVESKVPSALAQEILIKTTLLTLNDANVTGNYAVLHAKLAKPFREQFSPQRLKQAFKKLADQQVDWQMIAAKTPVATTDAAIDNRGALLLQGYFDTVPSRLNYDLAFVPSEGEWKPLKLNVNLKPPDEK
jgi:hypothetical protein